MWLRTASSSSRGVRAALALVHPRHEDELDEGERQHRQDHDDTGQQHHDGEQPADARFERDVTEAQRGHHRQRPVDARRPAVVASLRGHQDMECDAEHDDQNDDAGDHPQHQTCVPAPERIRERAQQRGQRLHEVGDVDDMSKPSV